MTSRPVYASARRTEIRQEERGAIGPGGHVSRDALVKPFLAFSHGVDALNAKVGKLAAWLVLLACLISAANAMIRYGMNSSSNAWLEIQWYMFSGIFLLGASYTFKVNEHVRVDIVYAIVSDRTRLWIDCLGTLLFMLPAVAILTWMTWPLFANSVVKAPEGATVPSVSATLSGFLHPAGWEHSDMAGGIIRWPVKILMPIGFFLLTLQGLSELIKRIAALAGLYTVETKYEKPLQ